jgi:hypothetical protein
MNPEATDCSGLVRPFWSRIRVSPWVFSLSVPVVSAAARYRAVLGPPPARILFPLHILATWALPFIFLTASARRSSFAPSSRESLHSDGFPLAIWTIMIGIPMNRIRELVVGSDIAPR